MSTADVSIVARYMRVVASESCPIASLITDIGIFLLLAILAQLWRATYVVKGLCKPSSFPIIFNLLFYMEITGYVFSFIFY